MKEFKFFRGYKEKTLIEQWEDIVRDYPQTTGTATIITNPTWVVNPGLIQYAPPTHTITYTPGYYGTITTTPGTGTYTIPYSGTINTATGFSLTTSNTNGTTYTTANFGGTLTTNTAFLNTEILTGTSTSSTNFK